MGFKVTLNKIQKEVREQSERRKFYLEETASSKAGENQAHWKPV